MNSNSTIAEGATRRENTGLGNMIKALVWEECRVGGAIAGCCVAVGLFGLLFNRVSLSDGSLQKDPELILVFAVGMPMLTAFLLILSTDYSGHLIGGFSRRILHLPVPVSCAVAVALVARSMFVLMSALVITAGCHALFGIGPGIGAVPGITMFYLLAQTIDWLRKPLSGLSSLLIVGLVVVFVLFGLGDDVVTAMRTVVNHLAALAILLCLALAPAYGIAVVAVHAARVGRRIGIPELWEWPRFVSVPWLARSRPFATPLAAQVWFDLRRSWWVLPGVTAVFCVLAPASIWLTAKPDWESYEFLRPTVTLSAFAGLVFGAVMHGGLTGLGPIRRSAKPLPQFLHPLTSAQFAFARIIANLTIFIPMIIAVLVLHFALLGGRLVTEIIPDALAIGATSYREVVWILLCRGLAVGLIAWPLMNGGNRIIAGLLATELLFVAVLGWFNYVHFAIDWESSRILLPTLAIIVALGAFARAWRIGVISLRAAVIAAGVWALATWVLLHAIHSVMLLAGSRIAWYASGLITCLAWAALIPLPYAAVALDVRRRRHLAAVPQDPAQHATAPSPLFRGRSRIAGRLALACIAVFFIWLTWPARPAYERYWRAHGYPVTLEEWNDSYKYVPDDRNAALSYLELAREAEVAKFRFDAKYRANQAVIYKDPSIYNTLLVVGKATCPRGEPLDLEIWKATEAYWNDVTSTVAPELKQLATDDTTGSRYPIDLRDTPTVDMSHLSEVRQLARHLSIDSLHWAVAGKPAKAAESILAMMPLANSLAEEPLIVSQLVRFSILGIANGALQEAVNRCVMSDEALVSLERAFTNALPPTSQGMIMDRAVIGEGASSLNYIASSELLPTDARIRRFHVSDRLSGTEILFWQLVAPTAGERMAMVRVYARLLNAPKDPRQFNAYWHDFEMTLSDGGAALFSPLSANLAPGFLRAYETEWRYHWQLDIARTAIAVERYRLANGRLPETLEDLVPAYLPEIPLDYYDRGMTLHRRFQGPLRYRHLAEDSFVVYSVGPDGEDDQGVEMEKWWQEGDITFTVAPLSVRTGPQVLSEQASARL